jgi:hypothetical protein
MALPCRSFRDRKRTCREKNIVQFIRAADERPGFNSHLGNGVRIEPA